MTGDPVDARNFDTPEKLADAAMASVFGVTPQQERGMVHALQADGHTVAMTGDGVNDVLALKDADLGSRWPGSSATRAVAKVVLLDDRFATLPHVVAEGRRVIGNIERVANLFLATKTVYSALLALLVVLWRVQFPFQPIHVTITGWFTIGIPAFLVARAQPRARPAGFVARVMRLGLPSGVIIAAVTFVTYLLVRPAFGLDSEAGREQVAAALLGGPDRRCHLGARRRRPTLRVVAHRARGGVLRGVRVHLPASAHPGPVSSRTPPTR